MVAKLLLLCLLAAASATALPSGASFNFSHSNDDGSFYASYNGRDEATNLNSYGDRSDEKHSNRIHGGSRAAAGQFPFMAVIHRLAGHGQYFVCGGSIISKRWILTAGHCIASKPQRFLVAFGVVDKSNFKYDRISGEGVSMITTQGAVHPGYALARHDIGLVYTPKDIPFSDTIQPIKLPGISSKDQSLVNKVGQIYGWGKDRYEGQAVSQLKFGRVTIISNNECRKTWDVDHTQVCIESTIGDDVCQGDSGGPLVVLDEEGNSVQVGVVSYGDGGCPGNRPSVFTRVSAYLSWIKNVTEIDYEL